jgi:hypothetical protein
MLKKINVLMFDKFMAFEGPKTQRDVLYKIMKFV